MTRFLPILITVIILAVAVVGGFFVFKKLTEAPQKEVEEASVKTLDISSFPFVSLIPGGSCEYTFKLDGIEESVASIDYEIVYKNADGVTQGVPGSVDLKSANSLTRDLLFGTESSGHRRCDKGVAGGNIVIKYRDKDGKLITKIEDIPFSIQENSQEISLEGITVTFNKTVSKAVLLNSKGLPVLKEEKSSAAPVQIKGGTYTPFVTSQYSAGMTVESEKQKPIYAWNGSSWTELPAGAATFVGTFVTSQ